MRHILEAIVHIDNSELNMPFVAPLSPPGTVGHQLRRSHTAAMALEEIIELELDTLRRNSTRPIAIINPFRKHDTSPMFTMLTRAIQSARDETAFTDGPTQTRMAWYCTHEEDSRRITRSEVWTTNNEFRSFCEAHDREEAVELREVPEGEEIEETEEYIDPVGALGPDTRCRISRALPDWLYERYAEMGFTIMRGHTGRILWDERVADNEGNIHRGWYIQMDEGFEATIPQDLVGAVI